MTAYIETPQHRIPTAARAAFAAGLAAGQPTPLLDETRGWTRTVLTVFANEEIYAEGDETDTFYQVTQGVIRTCKYLGDGRRQIDAFYVPDELFGFEMSAERAFSAEAVTDCTVICYRRTGGRFDAAAIPAQLFPYAMRCLARAQAHSLLLGRRSASEKVAAFLVEWAGHADSDLITLVMTRNDIADYLGLTFETVSRTLWQLERDELIELPTARQIRVKDIEALRDLNA